MRFQRQPAKLRIDNGARLELERISRSRTESARSVKRPRMLLDYADGETILAIGRSLNTNRQKVYRCVHKALDVGALAALDDLPRRGRPATISAGSRAWLVALACRKPAELVHPEETWTVRQLPTHACKRCRDAGHPDLLSMAPSTVSKILSSQEIRPHKITYYLERRDPEFDEKMAQVLCSCREVALVWKQGAARDEPLVAYNSPDEKPGIQVIGTTPPDRPPGPGEHATIARDHECVRHGTVTLMAGMDLLTGHVHRAVTDRRRSQEFVEFENALDDAYPKDMALRLILDNHSAHIPGRRAPGLQRAEPVRVRVHAQARVVAEPDRDVLRQGGQNRVGRDPCRIDGRTQGTSRALHRQDQRRAGGVQVDLWNRRCDPGMRPWTLFRKRTTSIQATRMPD